MSVIRERTPSWTAACVPAEAAAAKFRCSGESPPTPRGSERESELLRFSSDDPLFEAFHHATSREQSLPKSWLHCCCVLASTKTRLRACREEAKQCKAFAAGEPCSERGSLSAGKEARESAVRHTLYRGTQQGVASSACVGHEINTMSLVSVPLVSLAELWIVSTFKLLCEHL